MSAQTTKQGPMAVTLSPCHLVTLSLCLLSGCDLPGKPKKPDESPKFEAIYRENCSGCHGADGKLGPAPPLNDPLFRAGVTETELEMTIANGRRGTSMPAFAKENGGALSDAQIKLLVQEIKGKPYKLVEKHGHHGEFSVEDDPKGIKPTWPAFDELPAGAPLYKGAKGETEGDAAKGKEVFKLACAGCHGDRGQGTKGDPLKDIPPIGAINDEAFLSLISDKALRRLIITGRPDLGMPDYKGTTRRDPTFTALTSQQITDLVALLAEWRKGGPTADK